MPNLKGNEFIYFFFPHLFPSLSLKRLRNSTNPVVESALSTQIPFPSKNNQGFLKKITDSWLGAGSIQDKRQTFLLCQKATKALFLWSCFKKKKTV